VEAVTLEGNVWTPLPIVILDGSLPRWEFSQESLALVLWKQSGGDSITEFSEQKRPSDHGIASEKK
jgi:hypothetical protein